MAERSTDTASIVSEELFGAVLAPQGRGYYVTLELLALVWGTYRQSGVVLPTPGEAPTVTLTRRGLDFARRWMAGNPEDIDDEERKFVVGDDAEELLRALLTSLRVPMPHSRSIPGWGGQHLYPYVGELVHYDAVARRSSVSIERYLYRGAGGLAHKILRSDSDTERLERNRRGLRDLVVDSEGPLGALIDACAKHDRAEPSTFSDEREAASRVIPTRWIDVLCDGVSNITARTTIARSKKVDLLMHFVPFCIARHQLDLACAAVDRDPFVFPAAQVTNASLIRRMARFELDSARGVLDQAVLATADRLAHRMDEADADKFRRQTAKSRSWRNTILLFFTSTLAASGALNAYSGTRFVTLKLPLLESIVCASLPPGHEVEFEDFCSSVLAEKLGVVASARSAMREGFNDKVDAGDFLENELQLAQDLAGLGLLREFSDATRMVHGEAS